MKKFLCLFLTVIMLFSLAVPSFAAEGEVCPVIYIPGIASSTIYSDINDPDSKLKLPSSDALTLIVKEKLVPALITYSADRNIDRLAGVVTAELNKIFEPWFNNPDGSAKDNSGVNFVYPSTVNKNSRCVFRYDWRGNPVEIAEELNEFVEYVRVKSGSDKVAFTCHSLGSVIAVSYLSYYGDDKISGIVFDTPALYGASYIGDLLCGKMNFNGDSLSTFLKLIMSETEYNELVSDTLDVFELGGIPDMLALFLDDILNKIAPVLYKDTLIPLFGRWLTIWSMCPDSYVDDAMDFVFSQIEDENSVVLKEKIVAYNEGVRLNKEYTLTQFDVEGKVAVISRYGYPAMPITKSWNVMTDTVLDTTSSSFGAGTSYVNECFKDEYLDGKNLSLISPDRTVDASTCLFPEKTWFIKNLKHQYTDITSSLYNDLLFSTEEMTCDNFSYGRFLIYEDDVLKADNTEPADKEITSPLAKLFRFLKSIFDFFVKLLRR